MTDTHSHPYLAEFEDGGIAAMERALEAGVGHVVLPNVDAASIEPMMRLHKKYPHVTSMAMGLHPTEVGANWEEELSLMESLFAEGGFKAIGETGIDLYWDSSNADIQRRAFIRQLRMAEAARLPVIIHSRNALAETLECIREVSPRVPLVFHSFTGTPDDVRTIRDVCDPMFGINGVVTFKNAQPLRDALPVIGLDRIVLETDAPYLAPMPNRGKRNEPAWVVYVCRAVASTLGLPPEIVEKATDANASATFSL